MAVGINAAGELSYNGINFDGASRVSVSSENVRDEANQTTIYIRYTITVSAVIQNDAGTDANLYVIRSRLAEDGKRLVFRQKGFGNDLLVSPSGPVRDIRMGPKPRVLAWHPIGSSRACEVVWQVETCIPECESAGATRQAGPMSFNYDIDFDIDEHGDTTRTVSGYLEVVQRRLENRTLADTADRYRELLVSRVPNGFKRTQKFRLSKDKSRLDFTIIDAQLPSNNPYPKNVTHIQGTHTVNLSLSQGGFQIRRNTIAIDIQMKRGISGTQAWLIVLKILERRLLGAQQSADTAKVFLDEVSIEEDLFGRRCSFVIGYRIFGSFQDLMRHTGLWQPLPSEFRWRDWHESIAKEQGIRGTREMFHNPATDRIIDLCGGVPTATTFVEQEPSRPTGRTSPILQNKLPSPEKSYLRYENYLKPYSESANVRHSILQSPPSEGGTLQTVPTNGEPIISPSAPFYAGRAAGVNDVIQERGARMHSMRMVGCAVRVGHQIPKPLYIGVKTLGAKEKTADFTTGVAGIYFGMPVYKASWDIIYELPKSPGLISPPLTPYDVPA